MLQVEPRDGVAVVRMEHGKVNAMDLELLTALIEAFGGLGTQPVVLTGGGPCFSAGVDLRRILAGGAAYTAEFLAALSAALLAVFRHPAPVVAAVNGPAVAGGCVIALAADHRMMSGGTIGLTELRVGVPFPTAALEIVRYAVGPAAAHLALGTEVVDPAAAHRLGLVHEVCALEDLLPGALARARQLAGGRAEGYATTKRRLHAVTEAVIARDGPVEDAEVLRQWTAEDTRAAIAAFLEQLAGRG